MEIDTLSIFVFQSIGVYTVSCLFSFKRKAGIILSILNFSLSICSFLQWPNLSHWTLIHSTNRVLISYTLPSKLLIIMIWKGLHDMAITHLNICMVTIWRPESGAHLLYELSWLSEVPLLTKLFFTSMPFLILFDFSS